MRPQPNCGQRDFFWHLLSCYGLTSSVVTHVVLFLVHIAQKAHATRPPIPRRDPKGDDKTTKIWPDERIQGPDKDWGTL